MTIAYDGTHYGGWQIQVNTPSIQETIQSALQLLVGSTEKITLIGSGRTDSGVHALGQVAHFSCDIPFDAAELKTMLNDHLPLDIRILDLHLCSPTFHAQHHAIKKTYHYHLFQGPIPDPFSRLYATSVPYDIDPSLLEKGAEAFIGTHDFTSFANESRLGIAAKDPIRTIYSLNCTKEGNKTKRIHKKLQI